MSNIHPKKISPEQVVRQWAHLPHKFDLNVWNFEVRIAEIGVDIFKESFDLKRFNDKNTRPWARRARKAKHPLMVETGTLKNSITYEHKKSYDGRRSIKIFTNPNDFVNAKRHKGFCYAAVHNAPHELGTRFGKMAQMPQRQFIGFSSLYEDKIIKLAPMVFNGFPK